MDDDEDEDDTTDKDNDDDDDDTMDNKAASLSHWVLADTSSARGQATSEPSLLQEKVATVLHKPTSFTKEVAPRPPAPCLSSTVH